MRTLKSDVELYQWQADVVSGIMNHPHARHIVLSSRQKGKSVVAEQIVLWFAVNNKNSYSIYMTPTQKQSRKVFKELYRAIVQTCVYKRANESTLEITLANGSVIQFLSSEQSIDSLQGYTIKNGILVDDEAAYIDEDSYLALLPSTDACNAPILIISTPRYKTGFFYDLYSNADNVMSFRYNFSDYDTTAILPLDKLEFYRKTLPEKTFRQYYLGQFVEVGGGVFGSIESLINVNPEQVRPGTFPRNDGLGCVFGVDWSTGSGGDETSITVFNDNGEMLYIEGFNDKNETDTISRIVELAKKYTPHTITVELNSIGKIFFNLLRSKINETELDTAVKGFNTSNASKDKLVSKMQLAIQNQEVTFLPDRKLLDQMTTFESKLTTSGAVAYAASGNNHDDRVMSTLIAFNEVKKSNYNIL